MSRDTIAGIAGLMIAAGVLTVIVLILVSAFMTSLTMGIFASAAVICILGFGLLGLVALNE